MFLADTPGMDRRSEPRLKTWQPVTLTVLGAGGGYRIEACVQDMSGSGLQVRAPSPVPRGTPVKIDSRNALMLGEVCRCEPEDDAYRVGIHLSQTTSPGDSSDR